MSPDLLREAANRLELWDNHERFRDFENEGEPLDVRLARAVVSISRPDSVTEAVGWRCFHCNEVFTNPEHAAEHFGADESATVACKLTHSEGHLITYIRKLEADLESYRDEDSDILRAMHSREAEQREAVIRAEERGYDRGVQEAKRDFSPGGSTSTMTAEEREKWGRLRELVDKVGLPVRFADSDRFNDGSVTTYLEGRNSKILLSCNNRYFGSTVPSETTREYLTLAANAVPKLLSVVAEQEQRVRELEALNRQLAERCHGQSELLKARSES